MLPMATMSGQGTNGDAGKACCHAQLAAVANIGKECLNYPEFGTRDNMIAEQLIFAVEVQTLGTEQKDAMLQKVLGESNHLKGMSGQEKM